MEGYLQSPVLGHRAPPYFNRANAPPSYRTCQLNRPTPTQALMHGANAQTHSSSSSSSSTTQSSSSAAAIQPLSSVLSSPTQAMTVTTQALVHTTSSTTSQPSCQGQTNRRPLPVPRTPSQRVASASSTSSTVTPSSSSSSSSASSSQGQRQQQPQQQQIQTSQRYVEQYPECFWEEDPPPPYTPGPTNMHLYRYFKIFIVFLLLKILLI